MNGAVFLSASVPDPEAPHFVGPADTIAVTSAVKALIYVVLGRRRLIWGGHPAITPMVWSAADSMNVDYGAWVTLYQSRYFEDHYPQDNERFQNVVFTEAADESVELGSTGSRELSLDLMRRQMFRDNTFSTAIFIGGMKGVIAEFELIAEYSRDVQRFPILSTGGVTDRLVEILDLTDAVRSRLRSDVDYIPLFHDICDVERGEHRVTRPETD